MVTYVRFKRFQSGMVMWAILVLFLSFCACGEKEDPVQTETGEEEEQVVLDIPSSQLSWQVGCEASVIQVQLTVNGDWTVTVEDEYSSWISVNPLQGDAGSYTVDITVAENTGQNDREGKVIFRSGGLSRTVTVGQRRYVPTVAASQKEFMVSCGEERIEVTVQSNMEYSVEILTSEWIEEVGSRSFSSHTHYFLVKGNESYSARTGEIRFAGNESGVSDTVRIVQAQTDAIFVDQERYEMPAEGGFLELGVKSNVDIDVSVSDTWITLVESRDLADGILKLAVAANDRKEEREVTVTLSGGNATRTVQVIQKGIFIPEDSGVEDMPIEPW